MQIHKVLQFSYISFHIVKSLHDNLIINIKATSFSTFNSIKFFLSLFFFFLKASNILLRGPKFYFVRPKKI